MTEPAGAIVIYQSDDGVPNQWASHKDCLSVPTKRCRRVTLRPVGTRRVGVAQCMVGRPMHDGRSSGCSRPGSSLESEARRT